MRYKIRLSYNGRGLNGWQIQKNAESVQGLVQKALSTLLRSEITLTGAGRTDSTVSAINYVANFDCEEICSNDATQIAYKLSAILPKNIIIHEISPADISFNARFSAKAREYHYFIHRKKDPFMENFSYFCRYPLDTEAMNLAASYLTGEHDFGCFEKTGGSNKTSICTIFEASWEYYTPVHVSLMGYEASESDYMFFRIKANRFLRNMVRAIVGSLIEVGRGKRSPEWINELLREGTRSDAGESVPGNALFLNDIEY